MPEYNPAVALGLHPPENSLAQTFNTIANLQQSQAHTGLYTLQAAQQQRQLEGYRAMAEAYRSGKDPVPVGMAYGVNASDLSQMQGVELNRRAAALTPGNIAPSAFEQLQGAREKAAQTTKIGVDTQDARYKMASRLAGGVLPDPTDDQAWSEFVHAHSAAVNGTKLQEQAALRITDPNRRLQIATAHGGQGVSPDELYKPQQTETGKVMMTPANVMRTGGASGNGVVVGGGLSPGAKKEQEEYSTTLGKEPEALATRAESARQQNFTLEQMKAESASWPMGKGAETLMKAAQYLKPIAHELGNTSLDQPVADFESFEKNAGVLVRQAVKEVSPRAAVQEFNLIQKQLPSAGMSRQGFTQIADQFHSVNDYQIAKQQAAQAWRDQHGTMDKFDAEWNKNITPTAFLVGRMSEDQLRKVNEGLQKTVEGRAVAASLARQIQYAQEQRLF